MSQEEDDILLGKALNGDAEAVERLLGQYEKRIFNIALRMMGHEEDALDAAQETMIKVYRNLPNFKRECAFFSWVYRIAVNVCLDALRRRRMGRLVYFSNSEIERQFEIPDGASGTPESRYDNGVWMDAVKAGLSRLDPGHRAVVVLRDVQGFSYNEISQILKCNVGTVKSRISRARLQLQKILYDDMELL
ncbi:MAG: RNA polymerase sigma factor [Bacillota bacterium]|nr:RNA polymerase sigma factor [Bacillota bacterium]